MPLNKEIKPYILMEKTNLLRNNYIKNVNINIQETLLAKH